jgi:hypothetical protein
MQNFLVYMGHFAYSKFTCPGLLKVLEFQEILIVIYCQSERNDK